jgi:hypothetical protein
MSLTVYFLKTSTKRILLADIFEKTMTYGIGDYFLMGRRRMLVPSGRDLSIKVLHKKEMDGLHWKLIS